MPTPEGVAGGRRRGSATPAGVGQLLCACEPAVSAFGLNRRLPWGNPAGFHLRLQSKLRRLKRLLPLDSEEEREDDE